MSRAGMTRQTVLAKFAILDPDLGDYESHKIPKIVKVYDPDDAVVNLFVTPSIARHKVRSFGIPHLPNYFLHCFSRVSVAVLFVVPFSGILRYPEPSKPATILATLRASRTHLHQHFALGRVYGY